MGHISKMFELDMDDVNSELSDLLDDVVAGRTDQDGAFQTRWDEEDEDEDEEDEEEDDDDDDDDDDLDSRIAKAKSEL